MSLRKFKLTKINNGIFKGVVTEQTRLHFWTRKKRKVTRGNHLWAYDDTQEFVPIEEMGNLINKWSKKTGIEL